jgi:hypothetical protein
MSMFADAIRWFSGRGGVPPQSPPTFGLPGLDPVRATADQAEQREAFQEVEQYDPADSDKWPHAPEASLRDSIGSDPTPTMGAIHARALERMTMHTPKIWSTDEHKVEAEALRREAAIEGGWDNYTTAASMRQRAEMHLLQAALSDHQAPQEPIAQWSQMLTDRILDKVTLETDNEDVGADTLARRSTLDHALGDIKNEEVDAIIDELEAAGRLSAESAESLRIDHRHERHLEQAEAAYEPPEFANAVTHTFTHDHDDDLGH